MKIVRAGITDEEWSMLRPLLTHHGQLSYILRQAVIQFIKDQSRGEIDVRRGVGRRSNKT